MPEDYRRRIAAADARSKRAKAELTAAADDRSMAIADEVIRRGRGGARALSRELDVSDNAISAAVRRARGLTRSHLSLPADTLQWLFNDALCEATPLTEPQWQALAGVVRGIPFLDSLWISQPGRLLARAVKAAGLPPEVKPQEIARACRSFTAVQGVAVIDACQRDALDTLQIKIDRT